jgi:hypothetical protein
MTKKILTMALMLASFAAVAPAAVVYRGGYGYARPGVRVGVYAAPRYAYGYGYGPRVYAAPYVAPVYPVYGAGYGYGYGYGYRGYAPRVYGGGYYRGGGVYRGGYARGYRR